jgi:hypothetical protein
VATEIIVDASRLCGHNNRVAHPDLTLADLGFLLLVEYECRRLDAIAFEGLRLAREAAEVRRHALARAEAHRLAPPAPRPVSSAALRAKASARMWGFAP